MPTKSILIRKLASRLMPSTQNVPEQDELRYLKDLKERYELAVQGSKDGIWDWDLQTGEVDVSDRWKEMLGYKPSDFVVTYQKFIDLMHNDDKSQAKKIINEYINNKRSEFEVVFRMRHKKGNYVWVLSKGTAKRDVNGMAIRIAGSHTDITALRLYQDELRQKSLISEVSRDGILLADEQGKVLWANRSYLNMFEIENKDLLGKRPRDIFNVDENAFHEEIEKRNLTNHTFEFEATTFKGNRKWFSITNSVVENNEGNFTKQIEVTRDITEAKETETRLKELSLVAEKVMNGVLIADHVGRVLWANDSFLELLEVPFDVIEGKRPRDLFNVNKEDTPDKIEEVVGVGYSVEIEIKTYKNNKKWIALDNTVYKDENDNIRQIEIITDITGRKKREGERQLRERYNEAMIQISTTSFDKFGTLESWLQFITEICANVMDVDMVSILDITKDFFRRLDLYTKEKNLHTKGDVFLRSNFPIYHESLQDRLSLVANNVNDFPEMQEFQDILFKPKGIQSVLDIPLRVSGIIEGIIWCESLTKREWTSEDVSFVRSLGEMVSIAKESFKRREMSDKLSHSNYRLENILADSGDLTFVLNKQGFTIKKCYQNPDKIDLYIPEEQFLGKGIDELNLPTDTKNKIIQTIEKTIESDAKQMVEYALPFPDGQHWFGLTASLISFDNQPDEIIVTIENISEKKKYQLELEQISSILNETQKATQTGGWELDMTTGKIKLSSQIYAIYEEDTDFVLTVDNSLKFYSQEDRYTIKKGIFNCIRTKEALDKIVILTTSKGNKKWIRYRVWPSKQEGKVTKVFGSVQDITSMKKAQDELKELNYQFEWYGVFLDGTKDAIQVANANGQMVYINNKSAERLGISADEVFNYHISDFEPMFKKAGAWEAHVEELKSQESIPLEGQTINIKTKKSIPVEVTVRYMERDGEGFVIAVLRDISERKKADEAIKAALKKAEIASMAKSEFLANMSHEIRTPLNGVIGFTDLLLDSKMDETQKEYVQTVHRSANTLLDIINDILDFSKIEAGKIELNIERTDIFQIGNEVTDIVKFPVQKKSLELLLNISTLLPNFIWVDAVRLRQVLVNLLGNAVKFTDRGEIELKVTKIGDAGNGQFVFRFSVRDTGIGIDKTNQAKIFEAFSQEDASTTKRFGGTGLGLTISNKLLGLMGSKLQVESEQGEGSIFYFDLHLKAEHGQTSDIDDYKHIERVLIVDDNASNRKILSQMLLGKNIISQAVSSGKEAIELLGKGKKFDCILIDYFMPDMNGIETTREIRALNIPQEEQPVVLLYSSADDDKLHKECEELNISQKLIKPLNSKMLFQSLAKLNTNLKKKGVQNIPTEQGMSSLQNKEFTILLVEDNKVNLLLAKVVLDVLASKSKVIEAVNGLEAIEQFENNDIDIVFMDVQMPEMSGYEATGKIRAMEKEGEHCPIIALTAGTVKGEKEKCLEAGMDEYVSKPFVKDTIEKVLRKWLKVNCDEQDDQIASDKRHIDFEQLRENVANNAVFLNAFFPHVKESITGSVQELKESNAQKDFEMINIVAHRIKGTAMSACFGILTDLAAELEYLEDYSQEKCAEIINKIDEEIQILVSMI